MRGVRGAGEGAAVAEMREPGGGSSSPHTPVQSWRVNHILSMYLSVSVVLMGVVPGAGRLAGVGGAERAAPGANRDTGAGDRVGYVVVKVCFFVLLLKPLCASLYFDLSEKARARVRERHLAGSVAGVSTDTDSV